MAGEDFFDDDDDIFENLDELQAIEDAAVLASTQRQEQQQNAAPPKPQNAPVAPTAARAAPQRSQQPAVARNPYQITSRAANASRSQQQQQQQQPAGRSNYAPPGRPNASAGYKQPPRIPQDQKSNLSEEDLSIREAFLARNQERKRLRDEKQQAYAAELAQKEKDNPSTQTYKPPEPIEQQQPQEEVVVVKQQQEIHQQYMATQRQHQLSQARGSQIPGTAAYSHRQRQLQPRASYRQPTPYITQPTLPSSPQQQLRVPNNTEVTAAGTSVKRSYTSANNNTNAATRYHTAKTNAQARAPQVAEARPEEYSAYNESEELWDTAAPTEVVLQEGTDAVATLITGATGTYTMSDDMVDYDAEAETHALDNEVIRDVMDVDQQPKGLTALQLEELEALRKINQQLAAEKAKMEKDLKELEDKTLKNAGENSILRSHMIKEKTEHARELAGIKNNSINERNRLNDEVNRLREENKKLLSARDFDAHDNQAREQELQLYKTRAKKLEQAQEEPLTPRKTKKVSSFRDGFDDEDMGAMGAMLSTPNKGRGTPSKSAKRKRGPNGTPSKATQTLMLQMSQSKSQKSMLDLAAQESMEEEDEDAIIDALTLEDMGLAFDDRREFLETILHWKPDFEAEFTIVELLEAYHYPSDATTTLTAILLEEVTMQEAEAPFGEFPARVCTVLISLWNRCYTEKFFDPLSLILDFLEHVLSLDFHPDTYPMLMESFADVLQKTVMLNSLPRFKNRTDRINPLVDVEKCLILFERFCVHILYDEEAAKHFWSLIQPNFIAPFMNFNQPYSHIRRILNALPSSVFDDSFGPIVPPLPLAESFSADNPPPEQQSDVERVTLIHVSFLLTTDPKPDPTVEHEGLRRSEILEIRQLILTFYGCLASTQHGIDSLITNWQALSRITVRLHHEVEEIYEDRYGQCDSVKFVNEAVKLIWIVVKNQRPGKNIEQQLCCAPNGYGKKYLVGLTRVAFAKDNGFFVMEGVKLETLDHAMEVLESSVTMEEGDAIWNVFKGKPPSGGDGTGSTASGSTGGNGGRRDKAKGREIMSMTESMLEAEKVMREEEMMDT